MENNRLKKCLSGVVVVIFALISDNGVRTDVNFKSKPTTIKTFENDSVLLPCYSTGTYIQRKSCKLFHLELILGVFCVKNLRRFYVFFVSLVHDEKYSPVMENLIMRNCFRFEKCSEDNVERVYGKLWT